MSEHFFYQPLERIRAERRRRVMRLWLSIAAFVLLMLLTGWLLWCVRGAMVPAAAGGLLGSGLAMAPGLARMSPDGQAAVLILLMIFSAVVIALAVRKARLNEEVDDWEERARFTALIRAGNLAGSQDPLRLPYAGMSRDELRRILAAMMAEATEAREMARRAGEDLSVEDYGDRCVGIEQRIHGVILCLGRLADCVGGEDAAVKPVQVSVQMDVSAAKEAMQRVQQATARFASLLRMRSGWVRGYDAAAAAYRPEHGGYVS